MSKIIGWSFLLATLLPGFVAVAAPTDQPKVEYSALSTTETAEGAFNGMVYHAPNKERREMNYQGEKMTIISRPDKKVNWMLMQEEKAYMEMPLDDSPDKSDLSAYEFEQTVVGPEEVNGIQTIKSKIIAKNKKTGDKLGGFWWMTSDNIVVKMDMLAIDKDSKHRIKMQLTDLKIGKQDPALFEIPAGFTAMGMPNMQEMMQQQSASEAAPAAEEKKKGSGGFNLKSIMDMAK